MMGGAAERLSRGQRSVPLLIATGVVVIVVGQMLASMTGHVPPPPLYPRALDVTVGLAYLTMAGMVWRQRPQNPLARLFALAGLLWAGRAFAFGNDPILFTTGLVLGVASVPVVLHLAAAMPSGHLRSRLERGTVAVVYVAFGVYSFVGWMFADNCRWPAEIPGCPGNLLVVVHDPQLAIAIDEGFAYVHLGLTLAVAALVVRRMVHGGRRTRIAVTPVLVAMSVQAADLFKAFFNLMDPWAEGFWRQQALATVINGSLPAAFALGLVITGLAHRRVSRFAHDLAGGTPAAELDVAVRRALGDPGAAIVLRRADTGGYVATDGAPVDPSRLDVQAVTPVVRDGRTIAALVHDPALQEDPELLAAVSGIAAMTLDNQRLAAELQARLEEVRASRIRLVEAGDAERRRIERDLHDGAQQRLLSVALELGRATNLIDGHGSAALRERLTRANRQLEEAVDELRDLARGIHPPVLTQHGLGAALASLAERASLPVEIHGVPDGRLDPRLETAVYYLVAEALVNTQRHANASHLDVVFERRDELLHVDVTDDGTGGASLGNGSGLSGLRDRLDALDGRLDLVSDRSGTRLHACLPLAPP